jgi:hypothetical protein
VAPPRPTDFGFVDTMAMYSNLSYQAQSTQTFVNPYAAVPNLHVGWPVLLAVALSRRRDSAGLAPHRDAAGGAVLRRRVHREPLHLGRHDRRGVALLGLAAALFMQKWGYVALGKLLGLTPREPPMRGAPA